LKTPSTTLTTAEADALTVWRARGRLHPSGSIARRLLLRATRDPLRSESLHLLVASAALTLCAGGFVASGSLPAGWSLPIAASSAVAAALVVLLSLIGWQAGVRAVLAAGGLLVQQGGRAAYLPLSAVTACRALDPIEYHRTYRRYVGVEAFVAAPRALLLIETERRAVVVGLVSGADRDALCALLDAHTTTAPTDVPVLAL
jgi:hypothetical protein